ncbi:hypothetical protein KFL_000180260 [Klebsormidium nitens]|uniref:Uncharacterized protein n=1 Tax=Klebsormidium nitens TaxID=105231 RepID=A0A1Y1HL98_KLENI|nr:hypothetical protein KFL_000180260 [Klebsormidium nitens]|eukprot:GAQ78743.1 hypothetical protein KFL_000180260 [Klebsormidium nitens]
MAGGRGVAGAAARLLYVASPLRIAFSQVELEELIAAKGQEQSRKKHTRGTYWPQIKAPVKSRCLSYDQPLVWGQTIKCVGWFAKLAGALHKSSEMVKRPTEGSPSGPPVGGSSLTVSWKAPESELWHDYEDDVGRKILAAAASGQSEVEICHEEISPDKKQRKSSRLRQLRKIHKGQNGCSEENGTVHFDSMQVRVAASNTNRLIRWRVSSTSCCFYQLPTNGAALAALVAKQRESERRHVLSELLQYLTSASRISAFLSTAMVQRVTAHGLPMNSARDLRVVRTVPNVHATPHRTLYERFLDAMVQNVGSLGDALQALLGSEAQSIAPFNFAFHGTARRNLPSILAHGMSTEKRLSQRSGDWFAASPYVGLDYCRSRGGPLTRYQLLLFLLLPVPSAVQTRLLDILVISDRHFELPLAIVEVEYK